jgi:hypothetical protein
MKYCQCSLEKHYDSGTLLRTTYIPQKFAIKNEVVRLKEEDDSWSNGWIVKFVGEAVEEELLPDSHEQIKAHRKKTGDSLPKK